MTLLLTITRNALYLKLATCIRATRSKGDFTRDDLQRQFLAQQSVAMLEQCCDHSKQCRNNDAMLCCTKNRRGESSHNITLRARTYAPQWCPERKNMHACFRRKNKITRPFFTGQLHGCICFLPATGENRK